MPDETTNQTTGAQPRQQLRDPAEDFKWDEPGPDERTVYDDAAETAHRAEIGGGHWKAPHGDLEELVGEKDPDDVAGSRMIREDDKMRDEQLADSTERNTGSDNSDEYARDDA